MMISILLIYLIIMCWYLKTVFPNRNYGLYMKNLKTVLFNFSVVIGFFVLFFIFIRLLNLFREAKVFDLKYFVSNYNLVLLVLLVLFFYSLRRLVFCFVKACWFTVHYYLSAESRFIFHNFYTKLYKNFVFKFSRKYYNIFFYINILTTFLLILIFLFDVLLNNFVLSFTLKYLCYYSLFKFFYICIKFIATKQNLVYDNFFINMHYLECYIDDLHPFFLQDNRKLANLSEEYKRVDIFELEYSFILDWFRFSGGKPLSITVVSVDEFFAEFEKDISKKKN